MTGPDHIHRPASKVLKVIIPLHVGCLHDKRGGELHQPACVLDKQSRTEADMRIRTTTSNIKKRIQLFVQSCLQAISELFGLV